MSHISIRPVRLWVRTLVATAGIFALSLVGLQPAQAQLTPASAPADDGFEAPSLTGEQMIEISNPELASEAQMQVSGTVRVTVIDRKDSSEKRYSVQTSQGEIPISGDLSAVRGNSEFSGTLAIPDEVASQMGGSFSARVNSSNGGLVANSAAEQQKLMRLAAEQAAPLEVAEATVKMAGASLVTGSHSIDVAILNGASFDASSINSNISGLNAFWVGQSDGVISAVTKPNAAVAYTSSYLASCNFSAIFDEAAKKFLGPTAHASDYFGLSGRHLMVVSDQNYSGPNCGTGLGTVGSGTNGSGYFWVNVYGDTDLHTIAHEFGHNIGLGHADVHECANNTLVEGTAAQGCHDYEYQDYYDVMGSAFEYYGVGNTNHLAALNVTAKAQLGFLWGSDFYVQGMMADTFNISPASDSSGLRGAVVWDGVTGQPYYIEYRDGLGMDAGAFYTLSFPPHSGADIDSMRTGIRILKMRETGPYAGDSFVLAQNQQAGEPAKMLALGIGQTFTTASSGLSITYVSWDEGDPLIHVESHNQPATERIWGATRYETAVAVSQATFPGSGGVSTVYVAQGANYPDALAAAPAAVEEGAPLLLTDSSKLLPVVRDEIIRLHPEKIVVVGGTGVVKPAVFNALKALVPNTIRLGGADRYETSRMVVRQAFIDLPGSSGGSSVVYIATGTGFPDALSGSAAAGAIGAPIILVNGSLGSLDAATKNLLLDLGVTDIRIVGGTGVVSAAMQSSLSTIAGVTRFGGVDRFDTNHLVNSAIWTSMGKAYIATGYQFPDALAGAAAAGFWGQPLYLSQTACVPSAAHSDIIGGDPTTVFLIGGTGVLNTPIDSLKECGATYPLATS